MRTALIVALLAMPVLAQSPGARITGDVRDPQGAFIPGVTVALASTGTARTTLTNGRGQFVFTDLPGGTHELTVSAPGFSTTKTRVPVAPGSDATAVVRLPIGVLTVAVMVAAPAAAGAPPVQRAPESVRSADVYLDIAKLYYSEGRFADAEAMTTRALELIRASMPRDSAPAPVANAAGPVRVGGALVEPRILNSATPIYPEAARTAGVEGVVILEATIAVDGTVTKARVLNGAPQLAEAALLAVRQWRYSPANLNGASIEVALQVSVGFALR